MELNEKQMKLKDKMVEAAMLLVDLSEGQDDIYTNVITETKIPDKRKKLIMNFNFDVVEDDDVAEKAEEE